MGSFVKVLAGADTSAGRESEANTREIPTGKTILTTAFFITRTVMGSAGTLSACRNLFVKNLFTAIREAKNNLGQRTRSRLGKPINHQFLTINNEPLTSPTPMATVRKFPNFWRLCIAPIENLCMHTHSCWTQVLVLLFRKMKCPVGHSRLAVLAIFFPGVILAQNWTPTSAPTKSWQALAMSADGSKLVAAVSSGGIYTSTNYGATWISNNVPILSWDAVTSSADGTRMAAAYLGGIYTSTNGGATWNPSAVPSYYWYSLACSADGTLLAAETPSGNAVYVSTNFGISWKTNPFPTGIFDGTSVGLSASGKRLAAGNNVGIILVSTNLGTNWSVTNHVSGNLKSIAVSADGATLAAVWGGATVYTSTNGGASWTTATVSNSGFVSIAASADGTRLVTVSGTSPALSAFSTDSGMTWTTNSQPGPPWRVVASSADGNCVAAAAYNGGIWLLRTVAPPHINIAPSGSLAKISWTLPSTNFVLQQSADLQNWATILGSPTLNLLTLQEEVTVTLTNGNSFYRLTTP